MSDPPRPLKFIQQSQSTKLEVQFARSRKIKVTVQEGAKCERIVEHICKQLYIDAPSEHRVFVEGAGFMQPSDPLPPLCRAIQLRRTPSKLLFLVEADPSQQAAGEPVTTAAELLVDLSSVPRDVLPALRPILGVRRGVVLMRLATQQVGYLNFSLPFERQGVCAGATVMLVSTAALCRRPLSSFRPNVSGWLLKRSNVLAHRRFSIVADRCLIYFKSDSPTGLPKGLVPLDYYGVATFEDSEAHFRLANPVNALAVPLKPMYDFVADDGSAGWGRALLEVKSFPRVFGVPMQWNPEAAEQAVRLMTEFLTEEADAPALPALFAPAPSGRLEVVWLAELMDAGAVSAEQMRDVMRGCDPRSVLALFKRYLHMQPGALLPPSLSAALFALVRDSREAAADEALAAVVVGLLKQSDPHDKPALVWAFHSVLAMVLCFLHRCWLQRAANGATTTVLGRCFGHSMCGGLDSLADCALVTTTLVKLAPFIAEGLSAGPRTSPQPKAPAARWRCTLELPSAVTLETREVFFQFPEIQESVMVDDEEAMENLSPRRREADEEPVERAAPATLEQRVEVLEAALEAERGRRMAAEARLAAVEAGQARSAAQLEEVWYVLMHPKSPGALRDPIQIGRQRTKSNSSDADVPELPPKSPRGGHTLGRNTNK